MKMTLQDRLSANLAEVRSRISNACGRAGRDPGSVKLVAVVKYAEIEWVRALIALGVTDLAENRPQQLEMRAGILPAHVQWHLIGHLQNNKVRKVLPLVKQIHSVDSEKLLGTLCRIGAETGHEPELLLEVNISGETSKQGFIPDELRQVWGRLAPGLRKNVTGLMTMAPNTGSLEDARNVFRGLRALRDEMRETIPEVELPCLSMGMTGDFEVGIEEGATEIRVGSALFEGL